MFKISAFIKIFIVIKIVKFMKGKCDSAHMLFN